MENTLFDEEKNESTFENNMEKLEGLVRQLERGELGLEAALTAFEEGIALVKACQVQLDRSAEKIQLLTKQEHE